MSAADNHAKRLAEDREAHPEFYTEDFYKALGTEIAKRRRDDPEFIERIRRFAEEDRPTLERLRRSEEEDEASAEYRER